MGHAASTAAQTGGSFARATLAPWNRSPALTSNASRLLWLMRGAVLLTATGPCLRARSSGAAPRPPSTRSTPSSRRRSSSHHGDGTDTPTVGGRLPSGADSEAFAAGLELATRILTAVVRDTPADVRTIIWRQPEPVLRPPADFVPRRGVELVLHAHDVCAGLGVSFAPPADAMDRLRHHVEDWPYWTDGPPWAPRPSQVIPGRTCSGAPVAPDAHILASTTPCTRCS